MSGQGQGPSGEGLPPGISAAWGLRPRPGKGPRPGLTLDGIVTAAVAIAGKEGLSAVSMARVAQALGASTMSLYRYLSGKDELLALMVDAAAGPPPAPDPAAGWREALASWAWAYHERLRMHPWAVRIPITGAPVTPHQLAWFDRGLGSLGETPLGEEDKASVVLLVSGYIRSEATLLAELLEAGFMSDAAMIGYSRTLRAVADPKRFPAVHALLAAGVFDKADPPDREFGFGLERILDGVAALIQESAGEGA